jgi:hypothetical protein
MDEYETNDWPREMEEGEGQRERAHSSYPFNSLDVAARWLDKEEFRLLLALVKPLVDKDLASYIESTRPEDFELLL